jgi:PAS domain S-box-containing protein
MFRRGLSHSLALLLAAVCPFRALAAATPLSTAAGIRALSPDQAAAGVPVHLKGVVTALSGWKNSFFFQDSTAGISVDRLDDAPVHSGETVEIEGVTGPGRFAPVVISTRVRSLGAGVLPRAGGVWPEESAPGVWDSQWISVRGVVRGARIAENWGRQTLILDIRSSYGNIQGLIHDFPAGYDPTPLVDSLISVEGVCGSYFNSNRQFLGLRLFIPSLARLHIDEAAPPDPFSAPANPISRIMQFGSAGKPGRRMRVAGTVTYSGPGQTLYLQEGTVGIRVKTVKPAHVQAGDRAEASGFLLASGDSPSLDNAVVRELPGARVIQPVRVSLADLIVNQDGFTFAPHNGQLVQLDGTLADIASGPLVKTLIVRNGGGSFQAILKFALAGGLVDGTLPQIGSLIRLTGICEASGGIDRSTRSFTLLLRSPADIHVLTEPFWTLAHGYWLAGGLLLLLGMLLARSRRLRSGLTAFSPVTETDLANSLGVYFHMASRLLGMAATILSLLILTGWLFGIERLSAVVPGSLPMAINAAMCAVLLGTALLLGNPGAAAHKHRALASVCAMLACFLSAASLLERIGVPIRSDRFLFHFSVAATSVLGKGVGRMSIPTALDVLLLGLALLFRSCGRFARATQLLIAMAAAGCLFYVLMLVYGWQSFQILGAAGMAIPAVSIFSLLSFAVFFSGTDGGVMNVLLSPGPGGFLARRLLPASILITTAVGWLRWHGELNGLYGTYFGLVIYNFSLIVIFIFLTVLSASVLNRMDAVRSAAVSSLVESESRHVQLADAMPIIVWTASATGVHEYHNWRWFEYSGQRETDASAAQSLRSAVHPDDLSERDRLWEQALSKGHSYAAEIRLRDAAGQYRWHLKRVVPILGSQGEVVRWIGTCTDIQDYKEVQRSLQQLNEELEARVFERTAELSKTLAQLNAILNSATQVAIIFYDPQRVIRLFNTGAAKMLQYTPEEVVGRAVSADIMDADEIAERIEIVCRERGQTFFHDDLFLKPVLEGTFGLQEWNYVRRDGSRVPVALGISAVREPSGELIGYLAIATDITPLKGMELHLRRKNQELATQTLRAENANQAKDRFLAVMSHEIRTPMNAILGIAELLAETPLDPEQRNHVEICRRAGSALMSLIDDLLDLSKIEAGKLELEHVEFNVEEVLEQAIELAAPKARAKKLVLALRAAPGLPDVACGDPNRLRQVLINLLGNAVKFTEQGEVVLEASRSGGWVSFAVSDTGIGIPGSKLETIFEDFKQADSSTTRKYGGTGLGLGISRRLVELMGGDLTVESEAGRGSTFRFSVLLAAGEAAPEQAVSAPGGPLEGARALVLDANRTNRMIFVELLASWGIACADFETPGPALVCLCDSIVHCEPFDFAVVDCHMDEMRGFEIARCIRSVSPDTPVVLLTDDLQARESAKRMDCGLVAYATKPVRKRRLFQLLCDAIGGVSRPGVLPARGEQPGSAGPTGLRPLRILVAEDLPDNQFLIRAYLKDTPHTLTFVENGRQAVATFQVNNFDLILMDVLMPEMDGLEATVAIRNFESGAGRDTTPILTLSANAAAADIKRSLDAGCQAHLAKPISKHRLLAALTSYSQPIEAVR